MTIETERPGATDVASSRMSREEEEEEEEEPGRRGRVARQVRQEVSFLQPEHVLVYLLGHAVHELHDVEGLDARAVHDQDLAHLPRAIRAQHLHLLANGVGRVAHPILLVVLQGVALRQRLAVSLQAHLLQGLVALELAVLLQRNGPSASFVRSLHDSLRIVALDLAEVLHRQVPHAPRLGHGDEGLRRCPVRHFADCAPLLRLHLLLGGRGHAAGKGAARRHPGLLLLLEDAL
mmetsp:Transcript_104200/g.272115  ORF Transcript_104200/g.272115 Transcript_104200/m.272115 type:complete len:234 (+) Transcript_104200:233-934(+)